MKEIKASAMNVEKFIDDKVRDIRNAVGNGLAVNALSGGVDSCVVTALGHKALGNRLKTYMIDNGIMREGEPARVQAAFRKLGITVEVIDASKAFFAALRGLTDPEEKREAITQTFYKNVFGKLVVKSKAQYLLQGTILTDVDETVAGIKRQHNVFEQLGIDPQKAFGYRILEPLIELRKDGVRKAGAGLGLPSAMFDRIPFPGPALAARVIGEVTPAKIALVRKATAITEAALKDTKAFQYLAILHEDRVTGMRDGKRVFGNQIEIRCWESTDARKARPSRLPFDVLEKIAAKITKEIPEVVSVTYNITTKPTSTIEAT
ncbi:MAG: ExsB family transcriptional regulator [Syntrophaceae bacterium]|nr:ExsB family transcriptional regulator [Syntrophaceae bacterium]MBP8666632.1 ExsB family transcriptional regulator [Syntrophaceae bacterium]MBP9531321.1 ExsB family transcriptional regulator [Syntrophaceae bacterium]MBP9649760.1 ExsB family transcriptional regulator [Syntrophaceae bacterium]